MTDRDRTVLVIGATGQQGGAAARALLSRGFGVRALVRDPEKPEAHDLAARGAQLVRGDLNDAASLREAVRGAYGLFSVQSASFGDDELEVQQGIRVGEIAKEAGIAHMVYSSVGGAERGSGIAHFESKWRIEEHLRGLGLPLTVLRPVFFMENFSQFMRPRLIDGTLVVRLALRPQTRLQLVAVQDIGTFAALAFAEASTFVGRAIELAGDALTMTELAEAFQRATGVPARFEEQPKSELFAFSEEMGKMFTWFEEKGYAADIPALKKAHPGLLDLEAWLRETQWRP
jgi:uncharacterized protein YbjT (DUF2867 family)